MKAATLAVYTFTDQKNAIKGDIVNMSRSTHPIICPVLATTRRILHLRQHNASPGTPIYTYYDNYGRPKAITTNGVTLVLRHIARSIQHTTGVPPDKISARSLRPGGATALLQCHAGERVIRLLGRWRSGAMFAYLRTQAEATTRGFAAAMLSEGKFRLPTAADSSEVPDLLPEGLPARFIGAYNRLEMEEIGLAEKGSALADENNRYGELSPPTD